MPYITEQQRQELGDVSVGMQARDVGELNYKITQLVLDYLPAKPRYSDYNSVVGVLESAKLELYRRVVAGYENQKAHDNGDVYPNG